MTPRPGFQRRTGRYITQPEGYRAFVPEPLPPTPPIRMDGDLQAALSRSDRALGRLDGSVATLPNPDLFVMMYVRKEAVLSSQIEGTQSSLQDLLAAEAAVLDPDRPRDVQEVIRYVDALHHGLRRLASLPVCVRLIREVHERLMHAARGGHLAPGQLRKTQNWLGPAGCTLAQATFVPPPPQQVPEILGDLEEYLQASRDPLLVQVGLAHVQFETIHPFLDGNGRLGRLLIALLLCERKALSRPVLYLSHYLKAHRQEYYERLQAVRDAGDWEGWLLFFLQGVSRVAEEATRTARDILALREKHRSLITDHLGRTAGNGHRVLNHLFERPIVAVNDVKELIGTTYPAANQLVRRMEKLEILREFTGRKRHRRFRYDPYIRLFESSSTKRGE